MKITRRSITKYLSGVAISSAGCLRFTNENTSDSTSNSQNSSIDSSANSQDNSDASTQDPTEDSSSQGVLDATVMDVNGQINTADQSVGIRGEAVGDEILFVLIDQGGEIFSVIISINEANSFQEDQIIVRQLDKGELSAHILSAGPDSTIGDGQLPEVTTEGGRYQDLQTYLEETEFEARDEAREQFFSETVDDSGSDDLVVSDTVEYTDPITRISSTNVLDEQVVVDGETNRVPENNTFVLSLLDTNEESITDRLVDMWGRDGSWVFHLDIGDVSSGTYIVRVDDGDVSDQTDIEI